MAGKLRTELYTIGVTQPWKVQLAIRLLSLRPTDDLLDVGCGGGYVAYHLAQRVRSVTGMDVDADAIEACQRAWQRHNLRFVVAEITGMSGAFDAITCQDVLEHIDPDEVGKTLAAMTSLLRSTGRLLLAVPIGGGHGHYPLTPAQTGGQLERLGLRVLLLEIVDMPLGVSIAHRTVTGLRRLVAGDQHVDRFSEMAAFRYSNTWLAVLYRWTLYPLLGVVSELDPRLYRPGTDRLLVVAEKK